jgi:acetylglutamate kinase
MNKTIVVKLGGSTLGGQSATGAPDTTLDDLLKLAALGVRLVVVHGGGNATTALLKTLGIESRFHMGLRVTDRPTLEAALMKIRGQINVELVAAFNRNGGAKLAVGLSGVDGRIIEARRETRHGDIGLVGEIVHVKPALLDALLDDGFVPFIAPYGVAVDDTEAGIYNINADNVASHIAAALEAHACVFLTDVPGVLDKQKQTIPHLTPAKADALIADGTISGGMIPKIESALLALEGAKQVLIIDGKSAHALYTSITDPDAGVPGTIFTDAAQE